MNLQIPNYAVVIIGLLFLGGIGLIIATMIKLEKAVKTKNAENQ